MIKVLTKICSTQIGLELVNRATSTISRSISKDEIYPNKANYYTFSGMRLTQNSLGRFPDNSYGNLTIFLNEGINHLAGGRFSRARKHFHQFPNDDSREIIGFDVIYHPVVITTRPKNIIEAKQLMQEEAKKQVQRPDRALKSTGPFNAMDADLANVHLTTYTFLDEISGDVRRYIDYEMAFSAAEEFGHACQGMFGEFLSPSKRGLIFIMDPNLNDNQNYVEHDIAQHFVDRGLILPKGFMDKYERWKNVRGRVKIHPRYEVIN